MKQTRKHVLSPIQEKILKFFSTLPDQNNFYLAGGTALAEFFLGHRYSYDIDFFTSQQELVVPFSYTVENACSQFEMQFSVIRRFESFVQMVISDGGESHKVDLAFDSPFHLSPYFKCDLGININSYQDLIADKALSFFGRSEPRDAIDVYLILQHETLDEIMELAAQKDTGFDLYWFAVALNRVREYPDELNRWPVKMIVPLDPVALKSDFQKMAIDIMKRITSSK